MSGGRTASEFVDFQGEPRVTWVDDFGKPQSMSIPQAAAVLKEILDDWPGGYEQISSEIMAHRKRAADAVRALGWTVP